MLNNTLYEDIKFHDAALPLNILKQRRPGQTGDVPPRDALLLHWHEHIELLFFLEGGATVLVGSETIHTQDGDVIIVNPTEPHKVLRGDTPSLCFVFIISPQFLGGSPDYFGMHWNAIDKKHIRFRHHIPGDTQLQALMTACVEEYEKTQDGYQWAIRGYLSLLLCHLLRHHLQPGGKNDAQMDSRISRALKHIGQHYQEALSTRELAELSGLTEPYFCRLFHNITGMTVTAYIHTFRLSKAKDMLLTTEKSVAEIGEAVGFENIPYFSRSFKKQYALSPLQLRNQEK